ncbi:hypothetical protein LX77_03720 [Gelidibacter algens]|uniref:Uncharacterized protein n=1 Tax=Gelidibacter algens TaxID=49280 RepID=A0A327RQL0_9FLAO|nr:hypothetical protein LX77_03720 [Gelidibacter algens]
MKPNFPKYDLYKIECLSGNTIISESLRNLLVKEDITGMQIIPFDKFEINPVLT